MAEIKYCYRCGRHVGKQVDRCWYCAASMQRVVRPPRHCPYCDQEISPRAIKCVHCGEFLTEESRAEAAKAQSGSQTFHIEQAIIHSGDQASGLSAGSPERGAGSRALEGGKVRAIEAPRKGLPSPGDRDAKKETRARPQSTSGSDHPEKESGDGADILDVTAEIRTQAPTSSDDAAAESGRSTELVRVADAGPAGRALSIAGRRTGLAVRKASKAMLPILAGAARAGVGLVVRGLRAKKKEEDYLDVEAENEEDRYRICTICHNEILASDSYCFHCGQSYSPEKFKFDLPPSNKRNFPLYSLAVLCVLVHAMAPIWIEPRLPDISGLVVRTTGLIAPLFASLALVRRSSLKGRIVSCCILLASLLVVLIL